MEIYSLQTKNNLPSSRMDMQFYPPPPPVLVLGTIFISGIIRSSMESKRYRNFCNLVTTFVTPAVEYDDALSESQQLSFAGDILYVSPRNKV
jgi:glutaminase